MSGLVLALLLAAPSLAGGGLLPEDDGGDVDPRDDELELEEPAGPVGPQAHGIIHGEDAEVEDYPMTAGLLVEGTALNLTERLLMCSSTLIAPDVVLAAAHCVDIESMADMYGIVVEDVSFAFSRQADLREYGFTLDDPPDWPDDAVHAWDWVVHPDWSFEGLDVGLSENFDISLIFLEEPVAWPYAYLPTAEEADQIEVGEEVAIVGWGQQTANNETSPSGVKQMGMSTITEVAAYEFKVGETASDTRKCHGDSGGPSFMWVDTDTEEDMRIVGVTSHAYDQTDCTQTGGVDTRVDHYLEWIDDEMRSRCEDWSRVWCRQQGIVDPAHVGMERPGGCGCSTGATGGAVPGVVVLLGLLGVRRRRRG